MERKKPAKVILETGHPANEAVVQVIITCKEADKENWEGGDGKNQRL